MKIYAPSIYSSKPPMVVEAGEMVGLVDRHVKRDDPRHDNLTIQRLSEQYRKLNEEDKKSLATHKI